MLVSKNTPQRTGFYDGGSLHIRAYDSLHGEQTPCLSGDIPFYLNAAAAADGPVLELGSGTGRVAHALSAAGINVTGIENSPEFLEIAEDKSGPQPSLGTLPRFVQADIREFDLNNRFPLIIAPFRTFHALLTPEEQVSALQSIGPHLSSEGRLILHLFDPPLDDLSSFKKPATEEKNGQDYWTGDEISARLEGLEIDPYHQILKNHWTYRRAEGMGGDLITQKLTLTVRWTYRQEMKHLLALNGFCVLQEFGDFHGGAPAHGSEQILICTRA